jgi:hypothetical protein
VEKMKVIFLDFDGVLTTRATKFASGDPKCVAALNRITTITDAKIVVSSTWRIQGLKAVKVNLMDWGVIAEIIDITPRLRDDNCTRGDEIKQWLKENHNVSRFVILDDDTDMSDLREHLVKCDTYEGLTQVAADFAIQKLL